VQGFAFAPQWGFFVLCCFIIALFVLVAKNR